MQRLEEDRTFPSPPSTAAHARMQGKCPGDTRRICTVLRREPFVGWGYFQRRISRVVKLKGNAMESEKPKVVTGEELQQLRERNLEKEKMDFERLKLQADSIKH